MFRSVIAGFDASDQGSDALALARSLTDSDGELVVCCVYPPDPPLVEPIPAPLTTEAEAGERLKSARAQIAEDPRAVYVARRGFSAAEGLQLEAEKRGCDLIVVGSSHREMLGRILPGSVTRQVMQAAPCAVAVAPRGIHSAPIAPPRAIGVAYDGSDQSRAALHVTATMARSSGATVTVICVIDIAAELGGWAAAWSYGEVLDAERQAAQTRVGDAVQALSGVSAVGSVREGGAADELIGASRQLDLLVVGSRNYGPLRRALLGSVSGRVAEHAFCPVVVVPRTALAERDGTTAAAGAEVAS
jgi:nucleotide-binding universal stress UspA family protein